MSAAIVNKFMRMMGIGENDEDNEYDSSGLFHDGLVYQLYRMYVDGQPVFWTCGGGDHYGAGGVSGVQGIPIPVEGRGL